MTVPGYISEAVTASRVNQQTFLFLFFFKEHDCLTGAPRCRYYHSRLDFPWQIEADYPSGLNATEEYNYSTNQSERIRDLATALARYLFSAATGNDPNTTETDMLQADVEEVSCSGQSQ